jgi:lipoyl(octanoyl) transferase
MKPFLICQAGMQEYDNALLLQKQLVARRLAGEIGDVCLLLEHPPVLTMGTRGHTENIYLSADELQRRGIAVHWIDRGGDVTYHGPGQLVCYPIFRLNDYEGGIHKFVSQLQQAIIQLLQDEYSIASEARSGKLTGVWTGERKIAAIGLAVKQGISMHGFAFNINTDLEPFTWINPCGLSMGVTSVARELGRTVDMGDTYGRMANNLATAFGRPYETVAFDQLIGGSL